MRTKFKEVSRTHAHDVNDVACFGFVNREKFGLLRDAVGMSECIE